MQSTLGRKKTKVFSRNIFRITFITVLVATVILVVYLTGGLPNAYVHLIYIPIFLSAYYWGILGGVSVAAVGGILTSSLMSGIYGAVIKSDNNSIIRLIILVLVGLVTGYTFKRVEKLNEQAEISNLINPLTGTFNINKLIKDIEEKIINNEEFAIVSIKLTNIEQMSKFIEQKSTEGVLTNLIGQFTDLYGKDQIYMSSNDEIDILAPSDCNCLQECKRIIKQYSTPFKVNQFTFRILIKIGVYEYKGLRESPIDVYNKARIAYEQGDYQETGIYFYDKAFDVKRKELIEISHSLLEAIKNKELYLVYQPKIDITSNSITGVEVLTRWDRQGKKPIEPTVFINLAENLGFIKEITKFVLDHSYHQMLEWNSKGIVLDYSINFTANELLGNHFAEWEKRITENENIIKSKLEIEITERVLSQKTADIAERINELRAKGIKVSIDDYGTGVNSLVVTTQLPYDQIKINKYFIDRLDDFEVRELIREMIDHAHKFGREVVAEGVETKEQLSLLRELCCDIAQGYYFSKPLLAEELEQFYLRFQGKK
jgi:EAL domain-containing protein (putative c-di-GMP-specific phosphodiesterase class I)/GGDEF domain-containing protein